MSRRARRRRSLAKREASGPFPHWYRTAKALYLVDKDTEGYRVVEETLTSLSSISDARNRAWSFLLAGGQHFRAKGMKVSGTRNLTVENITPGARRSISLGRILWDSEVRKGSSDAAELDDRREGDDLKEPMPQATQLNWELFPAGEWERNPRDGSPEQTASPGRRVDEDRLDFIESLGPKAWYVGSHLGTRLYYVAEFESVAVADVGDVGNALYYIPAGGHPWRSVFRLSKRDALKLGAQRLVHTGNWKSRLSQLVASLGKG